MFKTNHEENWQRLLEYIDSHPGFDDGLSDGYICIGKFCEGVLPARYILNDLCFHAFPKEISDLNEYEKSLIQRVKAFQVVLRMNPVGGKKLLEPMRPLLSLKNELASSPQNQGTPSKCTHISIL